MGWKSLDLDELIESETGLTIPEYFAANGESKFREVESGILKNTKSLSQYVISCGGGTAAFYNNMDWMCSHGMTIYLNTDLSIILSRIENNLAVRPMFSGLSGEEIKQIVRDNINKLMPLEILNLVCIISCSKRLAMFS